MTRVTSSGKLALVEPAVISALAEPTTIKSALRSSSGKARGLTKPPYKMAAQTNSPMLALRIFGRIAFFSLRSG